MLFAFKYVQRPRPSGKNEFGERLGSLHPAGVRLALMQLVHHEGFREGRKVEALANDLEPLEIIVEFTYFIAKSDQ